MAFITMKKRTSLFLVFGLIIIALEALNCNKILHVPASFPDNAVHLAVEELEERADLVSQESQHSPSLRTQVVAATQTPPADSFASVITKGKLMETPSAVSSSSSARSEVDQNRTLGLQLSPFRVLPEDTNETLGLQLPPFRILCTSYTKVRELGSYKIRCKDFKFFAAKYFPNVEIEAIPAENATGKYKATILVKSVGVQKIKPGRVYGRVFVDIVDAYYGLNAGKIPKNYDVVVQNQAHANVFPDHKTHVVTHWYNSFPGDDKDDFFGTLPAIKHEDNLKAATVWNARKGLDREPSKSRTKNVTYDIIDQPFSIQSWYHKYVPGDTTVNQTMADPELGPGYLYRNLFQTYHVLVTYAKNGPKLEFGNVQRIVSQMRSGVPVLIEDRGYAHSSFVQQYSYPCKFQDDKSLNKMLEKMKSPLLRQECQRLGMEICKDYSPRTIVREYLRVLGMFE
jgi:hypothetical protein